MTQQHFIQLATFNFWANKKICDFISANLNPGQVDQEIISSFPSVKKTVYHIWDAEIIWLERLRGVSLKTFPSGSFNGSFEEGASKLMETSKAFLAVLSSSEAQFFGGSITFTAISGKTYTQAITAVLTHVMNHSTFHRGQLITMFRQLGFSEGMPETDFIEFYRESHA